MVKPTLFWKTASCRRRNWQVGSHSASLGLKQRDESTDTQYQSLYLCWRRLLLTSHVSCASQHWVIYVVVSCSPFCNRNQSNYFPDLKLYLLIISETCIPYKKMVWRHVFILICCPYKNNNYLMLSVRENCRKKIFWSLTVALCIWDPAFPYV